MSTSIAGNDRSTVYTVELQLTGTAATTGVFATMANPHGTDLIIWDSCINIITGSAIASGLDIGVAANATTASDTLLDGISGQTAGIFSTRGTNGAALRRWNAGQWVTVQENSGDAAGLNAVLHVKYSFA